MPKANADEMEWREYDHGEAAFRRKQLSEAAGSEQLGASLYELDPGKRSWPYHYHTANEEAVYVLAGEGLLRADDGEQEIAAGDFCAFPADERGGHQIVNDGDEVLRYLMVSTMDEPDVTLYPEMEKFGVFVGDPPGGDDRDFHGFYPIDGDVEYWEE